MYQAIYWLLLRHLPAEATHRIAFAMLRALCWVPGVRGLLQRLLAPRDPALAVEVLGQRFAGPLGLAAGFDKDARGIEALGALGFGFIEIGTVTALAQPGNPKPRMFRLVRDHALLNRLGFNNRGAAVAARRLTGKRHVVVGVNIGKNKTVEGDAIANYRASAEALAPLADYLVVNVSSPNTPGLRDLQAVASLRPLLTEVRRAADAAAGRHVPLLVKIAPDLADDDIDAVADLALEIKLDGIIATNTTIARSGLHTPAAEVEKLGAGGLSGRPLKARSVEVLRRLRGRVGDQLVLISVGGVETADDVWQRLRAGARLVQGYTGFVYGGPMWAARIHRQLGARLKAEGIASIAQLVGIDALPEPPPASRGERTVVGAD